MAVLVPLPMFACLRWPDRSMLLVKSQGMEARSGACASDSLINLIVS